MIDMETERLIDEIANRFGKATEITLDDIDTMLVDKIGELKEQVGMLIDTVNELAGQVALLQQTLDEKELAE